VRVDDRAVQPPYVEGALVAVAVRRWGLMSTSSSRASAGSRRICTSRA